MKKNKDSAHNLRISIIACVITVVLGALTLYTFRSTISQFTDPAQQLIKDNPDLIKNDGQDELRLLVQNKRDLDVINKKLDQLVEQTKK